MLKSFIYSRKISLFISIILMVIIFYFSHQTGQESSKMSSVLLVRKIAHITEYAVLAFFIYAHISSYGKIKRQILIAIILTVMYAASDEYHQTFIAGRSGNITDVLIDGIGVVTGTLISYSIKKSKKFVF